MNRQSCTNPSANVASRFSSVESHEGPKFQEPLGPNQSDILPIWVKGKKNSEIITLRAALCPTLETSRITQYAAEVPALKIRPMMKHHVRTSGDPCSNEGPSPVDFVRLYVVVHSTRLELLNLQVQGEKAEVDVFLGQKAMKKLGYTLANPGEQEASLATQSQKSESGKSLEVNLPQSASSDENLMTPAFADEVRAKSQEMANLISRANPQPAFESLFTEPSQIRTASFKSSDDVWSRDESRFSWTGAWIPSITGTVPETTATTGGFSEVYKGIEGTTVETNKAENKEGDGESGISTV